MTKAEIVGSIAKNTGIERVLILEVIEGFMECIKDSLGEGENVYLRGFGSFLIRARAQKVARNISRNTKITIPAHSVAAFKPARDLALSVYELKK